MTSVTRAPETSAARLGRLRIRSWRRGTREMDLLLGAFADARLAALDAETLALYESLLGEDDHDLYGWITGSQPAPDRYAALIAGIAAVAPGPAGRGA